MLLLLILSLLLVATAVAALANAAGSARQHAEGRLRELEAYGYAGTVPAPRGANRGTSPRAVAETIGATIGRALGTADDSKLRREIVSAGYYDLTARALVGYQALAAGAGGLLGLSGDPFAFLAGPILDTVFFAAIGWIVPLTFVRRRARMRLARVDRDLPDAIDLIVVAVEAGQGFAQAFEVASQQTEGPLGEQLRLTLHEQRFGLSMSDALENLNTRADTPSVRTFVRAVVQGERMGVSIGKIMRGVAHDMRLRRQQHAEERAQKTTVKILFPLVFLILPALMVVLLGPPLLGMGDLIGL